MVCARQGTTLYTLALLTRPDVQLAVVPSRLGDDNPPFLLARDVQPEEHRAPARRLYALRHGLSFGFQDIRDDDCGALAGEQLRLCRSLSRRGARNQRDFPSQPQTEPPVTRWP